MKLFKNQKGFSEVVAAVFITGIIGSVFILGVFVWQEIKIQKLNNKIYVQKSPSINDIDIEKLIENCDGVWQFGKCVPLNCKDSDAELSSDDIYNKGYVATLDDKGEPLVSWDECNGSGSQVIEGWCTDNGLGGALVYNCSNGCVDGACLKGEEFLEDSDVNLSACEHSLLNSGCDENERCFIGSNTPCGPENPGLECESIGDNMCHPLCETDADCQSGYTCESFGYFMGDVGTNLDICVKME
jgi:hypothetical protein